MKLVLIGDIHLYTLRVPLRRLLSRRAMAHANLLLNRRHHFNHGLLPAVIERARLLKPDHVLFSGDVSTSSLESEFQDFLDHARPLLEAAPCTLVPGNHDRYTFRSRRVRRIETLLGGLLPEGFPHVRALRPGWTLLALDSAVPNRFVSRGALGRAQLRRALEAIGAVPPDQALLVLCHYPCSLPDDVPSPWSRSLKEARALERALAACPGRVVYLHGHIHRPWRAATTEGGAAFECINAGAPCQIGTAWPLGQGFWEINLPDDPQGQLKTRHHALHPGPGHPSGQAVAADASRADGTDPPRAGRGPVEGRWRVGAGP